MFPVGGGQGGYNSRNLVSLGLLIGPIGNATWRQSLDSSGIPVSSQEAFRAGSPDSVEAPSIYHIIVKASVGWYG